MTEATEIHIVNAFTDEYSDGGNPAGVVLAADSLTGDEMQSIAAKVGLSETAFVRKGNYGKAYAVRFFTPIAEVDLCGHATIAVASLLNQQQVLSVGRFLQTTAVGDLEIEIMSDGRVFMEQILPKWRELVPKKELAESLGLKADDFHATLQPQVVSTGLADIIIPLKSRQVLNKAEPNFNEIARISELYDTIGYHVVVIVETAAGVEAICRNFAPRYGIDEESATGTASGAAACYLYKHNLIKHKGNKFIKMSFYQGENMSMPAKIDVLLGIETASDSITKVQVGGRASFVKKIFI